MRTLRITLRIIVGLVFIFTGFVKAIDPLGTTYKFIDYFEAFHMGFFSFIAFPLAIGLNLLELIIGLNLLFGLRMKLTSWFLLVTNKNIHQNEF